MFQLLMTYQINISYETDLKAYLITKCADIIPGNEKQKKNSIPYVDAGMVGEKNTNLDFIKQVDMK